MSRDEKCNINFSACQGFYHCQLATHPPQLVWTYLDIVKPKFRKVISLCFIAPGLLQSDKRRNSWCLEFNPFCLCLQGDDSLQCFLSWNIQTVFLLPFWISLRGILSKLNYLGWKITKEINYVLGAAAVGVSPPMLTDIYVGHRHYVPLSSMFPLKGLYSF